jgi:hypothetical protein
MSSDIQLEVSLRNCLERVARGPSEQLGPRSDGQAFLVLAAMLQERGLVRSVRHRDGTCTYALTPEGRACLQGMRQEKFGEVSRRG